jgi:hypothetical protein
VLAERLDLRIPHRVVERETVHEQDRFTSAAVDVGELAGGDLRGFHAAEIPLKPQAAKGQARD